MNLRVTTLTVLISLAALAVPSSAFGASVSAGAGAVVWNGDENFTNFVIFREVPEGVVVEVIGPLEIGPGCSQTPGEDPVTRVAALCPGPINNVFAGGASLTDNITGEGLSTIPLIANGKGGNDLLTGGGGNDLLLGSAGADTKAGLGGSDDLREPDTAETPDDPGDIVSYFEKPGPVAVQIVGGNGSTNNGTTNEHDHLDSTIEKVIGSTHDDLLLSAGALHNRASTLVGAAGPDAFGKINPTAGESGNVEVSYEDRFVPVTARLGAPSGNGQDGENDDLSGLTGLPPNRLRGGHRTNKLTGDGHDNVLTGGEQDDDLFGEGGNDIFLETAETNPGGRDIIGGGDGRDTVSFADVAAPVRVDLSNNEPTDGVGGQNADIEDDVEDAFGGDSADILIGNDRPNQFGGGPGDDSILGNAGADVLHGEQGSDSIDGGPDADTVIGDRIQGEPVGDPELDGNDALAGGLGEDTIAGDGGADLITARDGMKDDISCDPNDFEDPFTEDTVFGDLRDVFDGTGCNKIDIAARDQGYGLQITSRRIKIDRKGRAKVKVSCPASPVAKCVGDLSLSRFAIVPGQPIRRIRIGFTYYRLKQNRKRTLTLRVKPKQRKAIRKAKRVRGEVVAQEPDVKGQPKTTGQPVEITAAKPKKAKKRNKRNKRKNRNRK